MTTPEDNIKTILSDWLEALRRHDLDAMERRMAPDVFWQGIREDFVCADRSEAMKMIREQQREEHGVEALSWSPPRRRWCWGCAAPSCRR